MRATHCEPPQACGWSERAGGFRCLAAHADPCEGVSDVGTCRDGVALRCVKGQLERNPCLACGFSCTRSPKTGTPICVESSNQDAGN